MVILVTGSRNWTDGDWVERVLDLIPGNGHKLIHGDAVGLDVIAACAASARGWTVVGVPAEWNLYGKAAGRLRNQIMVNMKPDLCLGFPMKGSIGTYDCMRRAKAAGVPTVDCCLRQSWRDTEKQIIDAAQRI